MILSILVIFSFCLKEVVCDDVIDGVLFDDVMVLILVCWVCFLVIV